MSLKWFLPALPMQVPVQHDQVHASGFKLPGLTLCVINMMQGIYDSLTFWEQLDDGVQFTNNRKFLTIVPVALFLLAAHGTDYRRQPLGLNLVVLLVLVIAKFPAMHKVRIFGINKY